MIATTPDLELCEMIAEQLNARRFVRSFQAQVKEFIDLEKLPSIDPAIDNELLVLITPGLEEITNASRGSQQFDNMINIVVVRKTEASGVSERRALRQLVQEIKTCLYALRDAVGFSFLRQVNQPLYEIDGIRESGLFISILQIVYRDIRPMVDVSQFDSPPPPPVPPVPANVAPILVASVVVTLHSIAEDSGAPAGEVGTRVYELVRLNVNVVDTDTPGLAIIDTNEDDGTLYYSLDDGDSWSLVGAVSNTSALLLPEDALIYFQPDASFDGSVADAITFRAWDQSTGEPGEKEDASTNGGSSAFSEDTDTASVIVVATGSENSAPVLNTAIAISLPNILENSPIPTGGMGVLVSTLVSLVGSGVPQNVTDTDGQTPGIAVVGRSANGTLYYSLNGGTDWIAADPVSETNALLLRQTDRIYFKPNLNFSGNIPSVLTIRAWDQTDGAFGTYHNAFSTGGTSAFSSSSQHEISITVTDVNSAPILDTAINPALAAVSQDAAVPSGAVGSLVSTLVGLNTLGSGPQNVSDADAQTPGIAIVATNEANGTLYKSTDGGTSWSTLGSVSVVSALLLRPTDRVYFKPNASFNGTVANVLTIKAWDQSVGIFGTNVDTTASGGTSAFSAQTDTVSIVVTATASSFVSLADYITIGSTWQWSTQGKRLCAQATTNQMGLGNRTPAQDAADQKPWGRKVAILPYKPAAGTLTDYIAGTPTAKTVLAADLARYRAAHPKAAIGSQGSTVFVGTNADMLNWCNTVGVWPHQMTEEMGYDPAWLSTTALPGGNAPGKRVNFDIQAALEHHADAIIAQFVARKAYAPDHNLQWNDNFATPQVSASALTWEQIEAFCGRVKTGINAAGGYWGVNMVANFTDDNGAGGTMTDTEWNIIADNHDFIMLEGPAPKEFFATPGLNPMTVAKFKQIVANLRKVMNRSGLVILALPIGTDINSSVIHNHARRRVITLAENHPSGNGYRIGFSTPHYLLDSLGRPKILRDVGIKNLHSSLNNIKFGTATVVVEDANTLHLTTANRVGTITPGATSYCYFLGSNFEYQCGLSALVMQIEPDEPQHFLPHYNLNQKFSEAVAMNVWEDLVSPSSDSFQVCNSSGVELSDSDILVNFPGSYARRQFMGAELRVHTEDMRFSIA